MTKRSIAWALTVLLATFASAAFADTAPQPSGTLSGVILDADKKPVSGASVFIDDFDYDARAFRPIAKTTSDPDGSFHLKSGAPVFRKLHDLRIVADGFAPMTVPSPTFSIIPDGDTDLGKIPLDRGQVLSGQVLDVDGKPAANAIVECEARRFVTATFGDPMAPRYQLRTDADGRFSTPPLPVSYAGLCVIVPGRLRPWICVPVGPEPHAELEPIRLQSCPPIVGYLRDEQGKPIIGAKVTACGWKFGPSWWLCTTERF